MKDQFLIITEHHPSHTATPGQTFRQTIITWLAKELYK